MHFNHGTLKIANTLNDVPLVELEEGTQIQVLKGESDPDYERDWDIEPGDPINSLNTYILNRKIDCIYDFEKIITTVYKGDQGAYSETSFKREFYLKLKNKLHFMHDASDNDEITPMYLNKVDEEEDDLDGDEMLSIIHKEIFTNDHEGIPTLHKLKSVDNKYFQFINFKIDNDTHIVFQFSYKIDFDKKVMNRGSWIEIHSKDGVYYQLDVNFESMTKMLLEAKVIHDHQFTFLQDMERASVYNMKHYLEERDSNQDEGFKNLCSQLYLIPFYELKQMFYPIWSRLDLKIDFYKRYLGQASIIEYVYLDGKRTTIKDIKNSQELWDEYRIAKAINNFNLEDQYGFFHTNLSKYKVSPYDGEIYLDGEIIESKNCKKLYEDAEGAHYVFLDKADNFGRVISENRYYLKIRGYFVLLDEKDDKELINDLKERIEMLKVLEEN